MSLSSIEKIDNLFAYLYKKGSEYTKYRDIVEEHFKGNEKDNDVQGMLIKLEKDGLADTGQHTVTKIKVGEDLTLFDFLKDFLDKKEWTEQTTYKLSYEGRLLFEKSSQNKPYLGLKKKDKRNHNWIMAKTIAAVLNAIMIILIAAIAVYLQFKAYKSEQQQKDTPSVIRRN